MASDQERTRRESDFERDHPREQVYQAAWLEDPLQLSVGSEVRDVRLE
jgi:hypothetical protein